MIESHWRTIVSTFPSAVIELKRSIQHETGVTGDFPVKIILPEEVFWQLGRSLEDQYGWAPQRPYHSPTDQFVCADVLFDRMDLLSSLQTAETIRRIVQP